LDGDGDNDLVVGEEDGTLNYFENIGNSSSPSFSEVIGPSNPFYEINVGLFRLSSAPTFSDLDGDGDNDLIVGEQDGALNYFKNIGNSSSPSFSEVIGPSNPFDGIDVEAYSNPTFSDLDGDGDYDLVVGEQDGTLNYFKNIGNSSSPSFSEVTGPSNPFDGINVEAYSNPTFSDLDGDGDYDLVVGEEDGTLKYFENIGSSSSPSFS